MSLHWRKRRSACTNEAVSDRAGEQTAQGRQETVQRQSHHLEEWRRSAQRVTQAWNDWLAADRTERGSCYRALVLALAEEERAASEVERMTRHHEAGDAGEPVATSHPI